MPSNSPRDSPTAWNHLSLEVINGCVMLQPVKPKPHINRIGTALVVETSPLGNLDNLIDDLREERIQSQINL
jgi:hypothetical protein